MFNYDKKLPSTIFGYFGFNNYGDELLAKTLVQNYELEDYSCLSKTNKLWSHLSALFSTKQVFVLGGLFQDQTSFLSLFYYCFLIKVFKVFGKKIFLVAVGVGPITKKISRFILHNSLAGIKDISVRDKYSYDLLKSIGIEAQIQKDLAWMNSEISETAKKNQKTLVCIRNLNDWHLAKERFEFKEFDLLLMQKEFEMAHELQSQQSFGVDVIDAFAYDYEDLIYKISSYDKIISSRYHGAILGFLAKTDVKILEISPKLSSLLMTIAEA